MDHTAAKDGLRNHQVRHLPVIRERERERVIRWMEKRLWPFSNVYDMFQHQPILTVCLFGVPLAFFSIITYSICSADFSVERDEFYPDDDEEESLPLEELDESLNEQNRPIDSNKKAD